MALPEGYLFFNGGHVLSIEWHGLVIPRGLIQQSIDELLPREQQGWQGEFKPFRFKDRASHVGLDYEAEMAKIPKHEDPEPQTDSREEAPDDSSDTSTDYSADEKWDTQTGSTRLLDYRQSWKDFWVQHGSAHIELAPHFLIASIQFPNSICHRILNSYNPHQCLSVTSFVQVFKSKLLAAGFNQFEVTCCSAYRLHQLNIRPKQTGEASVSPLSFISDSNTRFYVTHDNGGRPFALKLRPTEPNEWIELFMNSGNETDISGDPSELDQEAPQGKTELQMWQDSIQFESYQSDHLDEPNLSNNTQGEEEEEEEEEEEPQAQIDLQITNPPSIVNTDSNDHVMEEKYPILIFEAEELELFPKFFTRCIRRWNPNDVRNIWIGRDIAPADYKVGLDPTYQRHGAAIIIEQKNGKCYFIGHLVCSFSLLEGETIERFDAPILNNDVVYSLLYTSRRIIFFQLSQFRVYELTPPQQQLSPDEKAATGWYKPVNNKWASPVQQNDDWYDLLYQDDIPTSKLKMFTHVPRL